MENEINELENENITYTYTLGDSGIKKPMFSSNKELLNYMLEKKEQLLKYIKLTEQSNRKTLDDNLIKDTLRKTITFYIDQSGIQRSIYFYDYDTKLYTTDNTLLLEVYSILTNNILSSSKLNSLCQLLSYDSEYSHQPRTKLKEELPAANGLYNELTEEFTKYNEHIFIKSKINTRFIKNKSKPQLRLDPIDIVKKIADYNNDKFIGLMQVLKQACMGENLDQSFIMFIGRSGHGKSTMTSLISNIIGFDHVSNSTINQLNHDEFIIELIDKHVLIADDVNENEIIKDVAFIKTLTGGGRITAKRKYMSAISFNYSGVLIQNSPQILTMNDGGGQFTRRLKPYSFTHDFTKDNNRIQENELSELFNNQDVREYILSYVMNHDNVPYLDQFIGWDEKLRNDVKESNDPLEEFYEYIENETNLLESDEIPVQLLQSIFFDISNVPETQSNKMSINAFQNKIRDWIMQKGYIKVNSRKKPMQYANYITTIENNDNKDLTSDVQLHAFHKDHDIGYWLYDYLSKN